MGPWSTSQKINRIVYNVYIFGMWITARFYPHPKLDDKTPQVGPLSRSPKKWRQKKFWFSKKNGDWKLKERFDQPNVSFASKGSPKFDGISATKKRTGAWSLNNCGFHQPEKKTWEIWLWIYLSIPFLEGWTSIYQLFLCSPGVQGFDPLPYGNGFRKVPDLL